VADVEIAVRLGRESRRDAAVMFARREVLVDDRANEVGRRRAEKIRRKGRISCPIC